MNRPPDFDEFEASELFCPVCRRSQPVRKHLLLVLSTGRKFAYRCAVCGADVGGKDDDDGSEFRSILIGPRRG